MTDASTGDASEETRPAIRGGWRLLRLFSVGAAWGAPFVLLAFVNPTVAAHVRLTEALATLRPFLALLMPVCAVVGVILVGRLSVRPARLTAPSVLVFLAATCWPLLVDLVAEVLLLLVVLLPFRTLEAASGVLVASVLVTAVEALVLVVVGVVVTLVTFWRRGRWLSFVWILAWGLICGVLYVGSQQAPGAGNDLGGGLIAVGLSVALVGTSLVTVLVLGAFRSKAPVAAETLGGA